MPKKDTLQPIVWKPELSIGVDKIDGQHKLFLTLTNELITQSNSDASSEIINETLHKLLLHSEDHFRDEEVHFAKTKAPNLEEHKELHRGFKHKIAMFCKDALQGRENIYEELAAFLSNWALEHICIFDINESKQEIEITKH